MHKALYATSVKHNGNRTKWTPFRSVIIRVINKIGRTRFTVLEQYKLKYRFQLIMTVRNFRKKRRKQIHLGQTIAVETISKGKNFLQFGNSFFFFFRISSCCHGYCDQYCDYRCPITANCPITTK